MTTVVYTVKLDLDISAEVEAIRQEQRAENERDARDVGK
jgi:hypothetical protein